MYLGTRQVGTVKFEIFFRAKQSDKDRLQGQNLHPRQQV